MDEECSHSIVFSYLPAYVICGEIIHHEEIKRQAN